MATSRPGSRRRRRVLLALLIVALAPGTWLRSPPPEPNFVQALRFVPVAAGAERVGPFRFAGVWQMTSPNWLFGSYSAMVEPAPGRLAAFSDRADFAEFAVPDGPPGHVRIGAVPGSSTRYKQYRDIEAAAHDPITQHTFFALEGRNAIARHGSGLAREALRAVPEMRGWGNNTGPEAMAQLGDGRFMVLCECTTGWFASGEHPGLIFAGDPAEQGAGRPITFVGAAGYRPTDMVALPDGRVLVLVRRLTWPIPPRFKARLLLADPDRIGADGVLAGIELARLEPPLPVDNFEALTITAGPKGRLGLWMLSDDNQSLTQRTMLWKLEFSLSDLPEKQKAPGKPDAPR